MSSLSLAHMILHELQHVSMLLEHKIIQIYVLTRDPAHTVENTMIIKTLHEVEVIP